VGDQLGAWPHSFVGCGCCSVLLLLLVPVTLLCLLQVSNLMGCLTTYGIGSAPPYFGAGYVPQGDWLKVCEGSCGVAACLPDCRHCRTAVCAAAGLCDGSMGAGQSVFIPQPVCSLRTPCTQPTLQDAHSPPYKMHTAHPTRCTQPTLQDAQARC
jgi:hypothetical protein